MPVYTVVPTVGLDDGTAKRLAKMLCYAGGEGQVSGLANGQLPAGYLPLTEENGLGVQRDYVLSAVAAVRAQSSDVPALDAKAPARDAVCDFSRTVAPTPTPTPTSAGTTPTAAA